MGGSVSQQVKPSAFLGFAAAAAAIALPALVQAPAQAACSNPSCTTFTTNTPTVATNFGGFTGGWGGPPTPSYTKARIKITLAGGATPFQFTGLKLYGNGITSSLDFGAFNLSTAPLVSGSSYYTGFQALNSTVNNLQYVNSKLDWSLPTGVSIPTGGSISFVLEYGANDSSDTVVGPPNGLYWTATANSVTATAANPVPGPVPVLGAAAAFGFTRRLRKRISVAA